MVMILSSSVLISLTAAYSVVVLPLPVGPVTSTMPYGSRDVAAEFSQIVSIEAHHVERQLVKLLAHRLFVEHAQHRVLAVDRGHDGHAEVDGSFGIAVLHAETAVLRARGARRCPARSSP